MGQTLVAIISEMSAMMYGYLCPKDINSDAEILEPEILDNKMWITI